MEDGTKAKKNSWKMKKRLYELDYIKLIAMIAVFTVHFTVELMYNGVNTTGQVFPTHIFNVYLGAFGVSLFFICSGAALMYVYEKKLDLKTYFKKRFLGIYPMFWIAFIISFCFHFIINRGVDASIPKWKIIYSILGIDGNALWWGPNFYQLGEWFLGVLICLYIIFPLLRIALNKKPFFTVAAVLGIYVLTVVFFKSTLPTDCFFLMRLPELLIGMIFIKYRKFFGVCTGLIGVAMVTIVSLIPFDKCNSLICVPIVGIGAFLALSYVFSKIPTFVVGKNLCIWASRYCYPFFLTHHVVICSLEKLFTGMTLSKGGVVLLYISCFLLTLLFTKVLYLLHKKIISLFAKA